MILVFSFSHSSEKVAAFFSLGETSPPRNDRQAGFPSVGRYSTAQGRFLFSSLFRENNQASSLSRRGEDFPFTPPLAGSYSFLKHAHVDQGQLFFFFFFFRFCFFFYPFSFFSFVQELRLAHWVARFVLHLPPQEGTPLSLSLAWRTDTSRALYLMNFSYVLTSTLISVRPRRAAK